MSHATKYCLSIRNLPNDISYDTLSSLLPDDCVIKCFTPKLIKAFPFVEVEFYNYVAMKNALNHISSIIVNNVPLAAYYVNVKVPHKLAVMFPFVPKSYRDLIKMDDVGTYSLSHQNEVIPFTHISLLLAPPRSNIIKTDDSVSIKSIYDRKLVFTDGCASVGGDTISFANEGVHFVQAIEFDENRCNMLTSNVGLLLGHEEQVVTGSTLSWVEERKKAIPSSSSIYDSSEIALGPPPLNPIPIDQSLGVVTMHGAWSYWSQRIEQDVCFFDPPWGGTSYKDHERVQLKLGDDSMISIIKNLLSTNTSMIVLKCPTNVDEQDMIGSLQVDWNDNDPVTENQVFIGKVRNSRVVYYYIRKRDHKVDPPTVGPDVNEEDQLKSTFDKNSTPNTKDVVQVIDQWLNQGSHIHTHADWFHVWWRISSYISHSDKYIQHKQLIRARTWYNFKDFEQKRSSSSSNSLSTTSPSSSSEIQDDLPLNMTDSDHSTCQPSTPTSTSTPTSISTDSVDYDNVNTGSKFTDWKQCFDSDNLWYHSNNNEYFINDRLNQGIFSCNHLISIIFCPSTSSSPSTETSKTDILKTDGSQIDDMTDHSKPDSISSFTMPPPRDFYHYQQSFFSSNPQQLPPVDYLLYHTVPPTSPKVSSFKSLSLDNPHIFSDNSVSLWEYIYPSSNHCYFV